MGVGYPGASCGEKLKEIYNPPAALALVSEFVANEDRDADSNNWVYGKDFMISNSDSDKPPMLKSLEESLDWPTVDPPAYTWAYYLSNIKGE